MFFNQIFRQNDSFNCQEIINKLEFLKVYQTFAGNELEFQDNCTYFIVKNPQKDEELNKINFLKNVTKIGQSTNAERRQNDYVVISGSHTMYKTNLGVSSKAVTYIESITSMNINLLNLDGSKCRPHYIFIDPEILNFEQQNLLAMNFFDDIYRQYLEDNIKLRKDQ